MYLFRYLINDKGKDESDYVKEEREIINNDTATTTNNNSEIMRREEMTLKREGIQKIQERWQ